MQIVARGLGHQFRDGQPLFTDLDFTLELGDMVALTGPSGSGKSTLLSMLAGWLAPTWGTLDRVGRGRIAWVPQNPYGVARRTAIDHAVLPLLAAGYDRRRAEGRAREVLAEYALSDVADAPFAHLSGGEAQRLLLAQAAVSDPALMLIDEPTAQLDPGNAATVISVLGALAKAGRIVVIASHDPRIAETCSTVIALGSA